jgi:serine/threonine protein kinase
LQVASLKANEVEPIALYFTIEMLRIAEVLKKANIIHADIKPENFLLQRT